MELTGAFKIIQSQSVRFREMGGLSSAFLGDVSTALRDRYRFQEFPKKTEDFINPPNGMSFAIGRYGDNNIKRCAIYSDGILAESDVPTEVLDNFLDEITSILLEQFGVSLKPSTPLHHVYNSKIEIVLRLDLAKTLDRFSAVSDFLTMALRSYGLDVKPYEVAGVSGLAEFNTPAPIVAPKFSFERRIGKNFASNIFYSEAPLPTKAHVEVIQLLQSAI